MNFITRIQAVLIVIFLQVIWAFPEANGWDGGHWRRKALKVSIGFPFKCASYTVVRTAGNLSELENFPERGNWLPGLRVLPNFLALDVLLGVFLFFMFRALLAYDIGRTVFRGFGLGLVGAILAAIGNANTVFILAIILVLLPVAIGLLTRRNCSRSHAIALVITVAFVLPIMAGRFEQFRPDRGFSFDAKTISVWGVTTADLYLPFILVFAIGLPTFIAKKLIPRFHTSPASNAQER